MVCEHIIKASAQWMMDGCVVTLDVAKFETGKVCRFITETTEDYPPTLREFLSNVTRINLETKSQACFHFYEDFVQQLIQVEEEDTIAHPDLSFVLLNIPQPKKLTVISFLAKFSKAIHFAGQLRACLDFNFEQLKLEAFTNRENKYVQHYFYERLARILRTWDLSFLGKDEANTYNFNENIKENIRIAGELSKILFQMRFEQGNLKFCKWGHLFVELVHNHQSKPNPLLEELFFEISRSSKLVRAHYERQFQELFLPSIKTVLSWLRNEYLLFVDNTIKWVDVVMNYQANLILSFLKTNLEEYKDFVLIKKISTLHKEIMDVHFNFLKTRNRIQDRKILRIRDMGVFLWKILDGILRAIYTFWQEFEQKLNTSTAIDRIYWYHRTFITNIQSIFVDGSVHRLLKSVEQVIQNMNKNSGSQSLAQALDSYNLCELFLKKKLCADQDYLGKYFFLLI